MSLWIHLTSPTCAIQGGYVHAVEAVCKGRESMRSKRKTVETVCGLKRARRIGVGCVDEDGNKSGGMTVVWPPYVSEMQEAGYERCRECFALLPGSPNRMVPEEQRYKPKRKRRQDSLPSGGNPSHKSGETA